MLEGNPGIKPDRWMPPGLQISVTNARGRKYLSSLNSGVVQTGRRLGERSKAEHGMKSRRPLIWLRLSAIIDLHPCKYEKRWEDKKSVRQFRSDRLKGLQSRILQTKTNRVIERKRTSYVKRMSPIGSFSVTLAAPCHFQNLDFDDTAILHPLQGDIRCVQRIIRALRLRTSTVF